MALQLTNQRAAVRVLIVVCVVVGATLADRGTQKSATPSLEQRRLIIRSGTLFTKEGIPISLSSFDSEIEAGQEPSNSGGNSKQIKEVLVRSGSAFVRAKDLGTLFRSRLKSDKITDLNVETDSNEVKISGHVKKAIPLHFEIKGPVSVTSNGMIDMHESSMHVDKLPIKGLAEMLGMDPQSAMNSGSHKGIKADKNDIVLDPNELWGMQVRGKLTSVKLINDGLMLVYGAPPKASAR